MTQDRRAAVDRVPLLDISPFVEGSETGRQDVAEQIAEACESTGFFAITGHGVAAETIDALRRVSHDFFSRPVEEKLRAEHPVAETPRGYRALAGEALGRAGGCCQSNANQSPNCLALSLSGRQLTPFSEGG